MRTTFKAYDGNASVSFDCDDKKEMDVFNKIVKWCKDNDCYDGETFMQSDRCIIGSHDLIMGIIDNLIKFDVEFEPK